MLNVSFSQGYYVTVEGNKIQNGLWCQGEEKEYVTENGRNWRECG